MAVYSCECGLVISTSREHPVCPRCHRVFEDEPAGDIRQATGPNPASKTPGSEQRAAGVDTRRAGSTPAPLGVRFFPSQPSGVDLCQG
jgi:hypothetical protein